MDSTTYRTTIETAALNLIEQKLRAHKMSAERARAIARIMIETLKPNMTLDEIYQLVPSLDDHFSELSQIVRPVASEYDQKLKELVVPHMQKLIAEGKIEEANQLFGQAKNRQISVVNNYGN